MSWTIVEQGTSSLVVYDTDGTTVIRSIDWGEVERGKSYTRQVIIENNGTVPLKLHLNVPTHACGAGNYGQISWDKENYVLNPGERVTATITLTVPSIAPVGHHCSVDIGIEGTGA